MSTADLQSSASAVLEPMGTEVFDVESGRALMDHMLNGLAYCRMIFRDGEPSDFIYLYTNPAFERLTGLKQVIGHRVTEVVPGIRESDSRLFEVYGRVAKGAPPEQLEIFVDSLGHWFSLSVYSPQPEHFLAVFDVISQRKQAEQALSLAYERLALAQRAAMAGSWDWDMVAGQLYWSDELFRLFGLDAQKDTATFDTWRHLLHPEDRARAEERVCQAIRTQSPLENEYRIVLSSGDIRWIRACGDTLYDDRGTPRRMVGICLDITSSKNREIALSESEACYRMLAENSHDWVWAIDLAGRLTYSNRRGAEVLGYAEEDFAKRDPVDLLHPEDVPLYRGTLARAIAEKRGWKNVDFRWRQSDGQYRVLESTASPLLEGNGELCGFQGMDRDITARKQAEIQVWQEANYDHLTGLPNRRLLYDRLRQEVRKSRRAGNSVAVLFIDLDRFKDVNDTLGHEVGDALLKQAAHRLTDCVRRTDTVARLGGDEFTILLSELDGAEYAERVAQQLVRAFSEPFTLGEEQAYVTVSIGITLYPEDTVDAEQLLKNADQAMYSAKQRGRNCYQYFTPALQEAVLERVRLARELRGALDKGEFALSYQPIVELATGRIRKAEALIRWKHPELGIIGPSKFIPIAEETGLISDIGDWVFRVAVQQVVRWRSEFDDQFQVSIKKSPVQFRNRQSGYRAWFDHLEELGLPGGCLIIEITEALLFDAGISRTEHLQAFRAAGVQMAIDDFGSGYSALSNLKKFDVNYLKIDRAFIGGLASDSEERVLCEAIIAMAHKLGLQVIAKGVETPEQRDLLQTAGCDYGQGYLFARPVPADEFESLLQAGR
ncbi:bifunctional diguanylate cyclase/phosphodiesterase [Methylococcus sp. EFPC2]|uniref:sensor domain-containing protein n=1 Tax=Methylococcus sp. EFPC2 TaxID=2812648 RepID=UPI0019673443|nr:bifunctional diguanylate cyclase/phosphodiesterase [Methylococcus sp. EFPC2]QSA95533.1 EAL domain-containing protein [Methylococcus sp. EFPC2]